MSLPNRTPVHVSAGWNIGDTPNGGYLLRFVLAEMVRGCPHPDPISVTTHFLRPGLGDRPGDVEVEVIRSGRTVTTQRGTLLQDGSERLVVLAAFGDLSASREPGAVPHPRLTIAPPDLPPPEQCPPRPGEAQGVTLPLLDHLDIRLHPDHVEPGGAGEAVSMGWIRYADGSPPDALALPLFADALTPSVFGLLGAIGWVPTIELTCHVRARPSPGWVRVRLRCRDQVGDRMVEDADLWDESGRLVARARQIGIVRPNPT